MTIFEKTGLSESRRAVMMRAAVMLAAVVALGSFTQRVAAQQTQEKRDDLDVTMQIIVDPDAKLPDEVVRRIPLPARKSAEPSPAAPGDKSGKNDKGDTTGSSGSDKDRDNAASEHGKETSQAAQERAREAAEQREAARRAEAEERKKRERGPPDDRPDPPNRPPRD
jgi:hypothetical protein